MNQIKILARLLTLLTSCLFSAQEAYSEMLHFESTGTRIGLTELYTSEGCSSCPPAEHWFSRFTKDPELWTSRFPIAFHVDYWDYLGWKDPFSDKKFSTRQRLYKHYDHTQRIATPGFVVNGSGWNGWFRGQNVPTAEKDDHVGILRLNVEKTEGNARSSLSFSPTRRFNSLVAHIALLGFDIQVPIKAGENRGKNLRHDFVVLKHVSHPMNSSDKKWQSELDISVPKAYRKQRKAIVAWLSERDDPKPIQVTGGWY